MQFTTQRFAVAAITLTCVSAATSPAAAASRVHGVVADASGGVLPGVTISATDDDGKVVATAVTDGVGAYTLSGLPAGQLTITYELDGFAAARLVFTLYDRSVDVVVNRRLAIATQSEVVTVYGSAPVDPPTPEIPPPAPQTVVTMPLQDRDSICGPAKLGADTESLGTIKSRRNAPEYELYVQGDELDINGGTANGLDVGRYLAVRRSYRAGNSRRAANAEHTAGLIQIVDAQERSSIAVVVFACDELRRGDRLAAFTPQPARSPDPTGTPDFQNAARVLFADAGQMLGVPWRLMVIDRGRGDGLRVGQRLTLFRRRDDKPGPVTVGHAVIVAVRADSATIRVDRATEPIATGDWAAPERRDPSAPAPDNIPARRHP